jgi:hypothetical protein
VRTVSLIRVIAPTIGALAFVAAASAAGDPPIVLSWTAPSRADCPDSAYVLGEIKRYVGATGARSGEPIRAKATVRAGGLDRWQLLLETTDGGVEGERVFQDDSCRAVADAAVVVLAWMIDPDAMATSSSPVPEKTVLPRTPALDRTPVDARKARPVRPFIALGLVGDVGTLPQPALGTQLQGGAAWRRFRLAARAGYSARRSKAASIPSEGGSAGARFSLETFGLDGCFDVIREAPAQRLGLSLCTSPEIDWVHGTGFGISDPTRGSKAWFALGGGVEARLVLRGPLRLVFDGRVVVPTEREHFALHGVGEIYRPAIVAGRVGLGIELEL